MDRLPRPARAPTRQDQGEPANIGISDIASFQFNFFTVRPVDEAWIEFNLDDIKSFSAFVYGANGGASPRTFAMVAHSDKWHLQGNATLPPPSTIYFKDRTFRLIADGGELIASGYLGLSVPEPAAWAFMLAGFGVVGISLRARQPLRRQCASAPSRHI